MSDITRFPIVEIFTSIQGEGCNLGKAAHFIRLAGCNLNCVWCDTKWNEATLGNLTIEQIMEHLKGRAKLVVITGGEPLMHPRLPQLIEELSAKFKVAIETNGTRSTIGIKRGVWISCSPKPQAKWKRHKQCRCNELKYVVDGDFTYENIDMNYKGPIWLQPEGSKMEERWKEAIEIQQKALFYGVDCRIGLQLHKIMEVK